MPTGVHQQRRIVGVGGTQRRLGGYHCLASGRAAFTSRGRLIGLVGIIRFSVAHPFQALHGKLQRQQVSLFSNVQQRHALAIGLYDFSPHRLSYRCSA